MPAKKNPDVMEMVEKELKKNRDVETGTLFEKARAIDKSVGDLSLRQFHARYPLQVKRKMSASSGGKKGGRKKKSTKKSTKKSGKKSAKKASGARRGGSGGDARREVVRDGLLSFARDVAAADQKADLIGILTSVDDYVDQVLAGLEKAGS